MTRDPITALPAPNGFSADPLTYLIRTGAGQFVEQALEAGLGALYLRKAKPVEELLPWLYLKAISSGNFQDALTASNKFKPPPDHAVTNFRALHLHQARIQSLHQIAGAQIFDGFCASVGQYQGTRYVAGNTD